MMQVLYFRRMCIHVDEHWSLIVTCITVARSTLVQLCKHVFYPYLFVKHLRIDYSFHIICLKYW